MSRKEVVKGDSSTTKLRIVSDNKAKYKDTTLLNDILYKWPCLYSLLLKFGVHSIVLTTDIKKAYLQININEEHRDYLNNQGVIIRYRFTEVIFGVTSSEFLVNRTVQMHAKKKQLKYQSWIRWEN